MGKKVVRCVMVLNSWGNSFHSLRPLFFRSCSLDQVSMTEEERGQDEGWYWRIVGHELFPYKHCRKTMHTVIQPQAVLYLLWRLLHDMMFLRSEPVNTLHWIWSESCYQGSGAPHGLSHSPSNPPDLWQISRNLKDLGTEPPAPSAGRWKG